MAAPRTARTINEVRYYIMVMPCTACGKGPWVSDANIPARACKGPMSLKAHCSNCRHEETFEFRLQHNVRSGGGAGGETINPTSSPSALVDLAQWLSLFYLLLESAGVKGSPAESRRVSYRAALCLGEALKFYGDCELPPESAFFAPGSLAVFREHPAGFARKRVRGMQAKLPALSAMARRVDRDQRFATKKWWQFWRW